MKKQMEKGAYRGLATMILLSFVSMYVLMYAMVNVFENVYPSFNQVYMAGLMTAPMVVIELVLMGAMYPNKARNRFIIIGGVIVLIVCFALIRQQTAISDRQFLKSMIPHHAGAILMCERASLEDTEIKKLCTSIIAGQQAEIDQMKAKLRELNK